MNKRGFLSLIGAGMALSRLGLPALAQEGQAAGSDEKWPVPDLVLGNPDAPIRIIAHIGPTDAESATFFAECGDILTRSYPATGDVCVVFREVCNDRLSLWAALAARAGGVEHHAKALMRLFERRDDWVGEEADQATAAKLIEIVSEGGVDRSVVSAGITDRELAGLLTQTAETPIGGGDVALPYVTINGRSPRLLNEIGLRSMIDPLLSTGEDPAEVQGQE